MSSIDEPGRTTSNRRAVYSLWLLSLAAAACGGGRTPLLPASPSQTPAPSAKTDASASAVPDAIPPDGLLPSTPGLVRCGAITCAKGEQCCLREQGSPASNGCDSRSNTGCRGSPDVRTCDETADCNPGELCCFGLWSSPPATLGSRCSYSPGGATRTACDLYEYIGCSSDDDCLAVSAPPCVAQRCRGDVLQTCGLLPSDWCPP